MSENPDEPRLRSNCPGKCSIHKYARQGHFNIVTEIDNQIVSGISIKTVSEYARTRLRDVGIVLSEMQIYKQVYNHKFHMTEPIQKTARAQLRETIREERLKRDPREPSQGLMTNPDYVRTTILVPKSEVDKFRAINVKENLSSQLQRIEKGITDVEEALASTPKGSTEDYPVLHNMRLKYSNEYRELNRLALAIKDVAGETPGVSYQEFLKWTKDKEKGSSDGQESTTNQP